MTNPNIPAGDCCVNPDKVFLSGISVNRVLTGTLASACLLFAEDLLGWENLFPKGHFEIRLP